MAEKKPTGCRPFRLGSEDKAGKFDIMSPTQAPARCRRAGVYLRAVGGDFSPRMDVVNRLDEMGQRLFRWTTPTGHPDTTRYWTGGTFLLRRWNLPMDLRDDGWKGIAAFHLGEDDAFRRAFAQLLSQSREAGALGLVLFALPRLALADLAAGRWGSATADATEALQLARGTGQPALTAMPCDSEISPAPT